jgi:hypothetical protein
MHKIHVLCSCFMFSPLFFMTIIKSLTRWRTIEMPHFALNLQTTLDLSIFFYILYFCFFFLIGKRWSCFRQWHAKVSKGAQCRLCSVHCSQGSSWISRPSSSIGMRFMHLPSVPNLFPGNPSPPSIPSKYFVPKFMFS